MASADRGVVATYRVSIMINIYIGTWRHGMINNRVVRGIDDWQWHLETRTGKTSAHRASTSWFRLNVAWRLSIYWFWSRTARARACWRGYLARRARLGISGVFFLLGMSINRRQT